MIRFGVVGAGAWGINHVRAIVATAGCELAWVADPDPTALEHVCRFAPRTRTVRDAAEVLSESATDAVVIASPAATHAQLAIAALHAGKHVLVEKPLAMSSREASDIVAAARTSGRVGMVGHLMVYHPAVVRLRELLHSGALGRLLYLHSTRVNLGRLRRDENALWSFGPHDLSMIEYLLDDTPTSVSASGQSMLQPGIEDVVFVTMRFPRGELAHLHLSWLNPHKERRLTVVCSQKMAEFDDVAGDKLRIYDKGFDHPPGFTRYAEYLTIRDGDVHIPKIVMEEPLQLQLQQFVRAIETREPFPTDLESGLRVVRVLEAAQQSLERNGSPVTLNPLESQKF